MGSVLKSNQGLDLDYVANFFPAGAVAAAPSDTVDLPTVAKGLYIGGAGDVKVDMAGTGTVTFKAVPVGTILPIIVKRIYVTGTTATLIIVLL